MDKQNKKLELLGNAPIPKALLAMGIPTMIGMLVTGLYSIVDAVLSAGLGHNKWEPFPLCSLLDRFYLD